VWGLGGQEEKHRLSELSRWGEQQRGRGLGARTREIRPAIWLQTSRTGNLGRVNAKQNTPHSDEEIQDSLGMTINPWSPHERGHSRKGRESLFARPSCRRSARQ